MTEEVRKLIGKAEHALEVADYDIQEEIVEPIASLKIEEGKSFSAEIKKIIGSL